MTVSVDVATESVRTGTEDPYTFSHGGGVGPKGVLVLITQSTNTTDFVSAVTYGGSTLTRVLAVQDDGTGDEPGQRSYVYFLGSSVPTGTQTVSVDLTSATTADFHVVSITLNGSANLEVVDSDSYLSNTGNPSIALSYGGRTCMAFSVNKTGHASPANCAIHASMTAIHDHDYGNNSSRVDRQTTAGSADYTVSYTCGGDDHAAIAVAISEVSGAAVVTGSASIALDNGLTAASLVEVHGAANIAIDSGITAASLVEVLGAAALALSGTTTTSAYDIAIGAAAINLAGALAANALVEVLGATSIAPGLSVAVSGDIVSIIVTGTANIGLGATLSADSLVQVLGAAGIDLSVASVIVAVVTRDSSQHWDWVARGMPRRRYG